MKVVGKKTITLSDNEKNVLKGAARILEFLAWHVDSLDEDLVIELNRAYNACWETACCDAFEYDLDDGNE
jgi:hypothetical protein